MVDFVKTKLLITLNGSSLLVWYVSVQSNLILYAYIGKVAIYYFFISLAVKEHVFFFYFAQSP